MRIFPEMWARTLCPFSSSTRNMAFGRGSMTVPFEHDRVFLGLRQGSLPAIACRHGSEARWVRCGPAAPWRSASWSALQPPPPPDGSGRRLAGGGTDAVHPAHRGPQPGRSGGRRATAAKPGEDLGAVVGDGDGVLDVGRQRAVGGHHAPAVVEHARPRARRRSPSARRPAPRRARSAGPGPACRSSGRRAARAWPGRCRGRSSRARPTGPRPPRPPAPRRRCRRAGRRVAWRRPRRRGTPTAVSSRRWPSGDDRARPPTVKAASPCQPSTMAPQSIETRSPSSSTCGPGMPWMTTSLTEAQITAG